MSLSRLAPTFEVRINDVLRTDAQVLSIDQVVGSRGLDQAEVLLRNPLRESTRLENVDLIDQWTNDAVDIRVNAQIGATITRSLFYGRVVSIRSDIRRDGEIVALTCRLDDSLFGNKSNYQHWVAKLDPTKTNRAAPNQTPPPDFDPIWENYSPVIQDYVAVINPVIDGVATPNMWMGSLDPDGAPPQGNTISFIDPDSIHPQTLAYDRKLGEQNVNISLNHSAACFWTPAHAVYYFCQLLNLTEVHVENPEWTDVGNLTDSTVLRNIRIPIDAYLPDILNLILKPIGYDWKVEYIDVDNDPQPVDRSRKIVVFKRFGGTAKTVDLQTWGELLDISKSAVSGLSLRFDGISNTAQKVNIIGAPKQYETSIILRAAWDPTHDDLPATDPLKLKYDNEAWLSDPTLRHVYRRFVANEGGDYTGTRSWFASALDLSVVSTDFNLVKRRQVLPTISVDEDGDPLGQTPPGVLLEIYDNNSSTWIPLIDKGGVTQVNVLNGEIGIHISGQVPYATMWAALTAIEPAITYDPGLIQIRMTCSLESDAMLRQSATDALPVTPNSERYFDLANQFWYRNVHTSSQLDGSEDDRETDGTAGMQAKATELLSTYKQALILGTIEIEGVDRNLDGYLGARISKVAGREIGLQTNAEAGTPQYPMVGGIRWEPQQQRCRMTLETRRD